MRALRVSEGLTLREMASLLSLSVAYLSDLERGRRNWSAKLIQSYQRAAQEEGS